MRVADDTFVGSDFLSTLGPSMRSGQTELAVLQAQVRAEPATPQPVEHNTRAIMCLNLSNREQRSAAPRRKKESAFWSPPHCHT